MERHSSGLGTCPASWRNRWVNLKNQQRINLGKAEVGAREGMEYIVLGRGSNMCKKRTWFTQGIESSSVYDWKSHYQTCLLYTSDAADE